MKLQFYLEKLHNSDEFEKFVEENPKAYLCSGFIVIDKEGKDNKQHFDFFVENVNLNFPTTTPRPPAPKMRSLETRDIDGSVQDLRQRTSLRKSVKPIKNSLVKNPDEVGFEAINREQSELIKTSDSERYGKIFSFQLEEDCKKVEVERIDDKTPEEISPDCDFDFEYIEKLIAGEMFEKKISNKIQKILLSLQRVEGKDFLVGTVFISGMGIIKINIDVAERKVIDFEKKSFFDMMKIVKKGE